MGQVGGRGIGGQGGKPVSRAVSEGRGMEEEGEEE